MEISSRIAKEVSMTQMNHVPAMAVVSQRAAKQRVTPRPFAMVHHGQLMTKQRGEVEDPGLLHCINNFCLVVNGSILLADETGVAAGANRLQSVSAKRKPPTQMIAGANAHA